MDFIWTRLVNLIVYRGAGRSSTKFCPFPVRNILFNRNHTLKLYSVAFLWREKSFNNWFLGGWKKYPWTLLDCCLILIRMSMSFFSTNIQGVRRRVMAACVRVKNMYAVDFDYPQTHYCCLLKSTTVVLYANCTIFSYLICWNWKFGTDQRLALCTLRDGEDGSSLAGVNSCSMGLRWH